MSRKLKILFLCRVANGRHGVQTQWLYFFRTFSKTDHTALCLVSRKSYLEKFLREAGISMELIPWRYVSRGWNFKVLINRLFNLFAFWRIARSARRFDPDIIEGDINDFPLLRFLSRRSQARIVCRVRSHDVFTRNLSGHDFVDRFIPLSPRLAAPLLRAGVPESKIVMVNDGVDTHYFEPQAKAQGNSHILQVGIVGRIEPFKRIEECLQVAHQLATSGTPFVFLFVGAQPREGYFQEVLKVRSSLGLEEHCHFLPETGQIRDFYRSIDVLLTLSGGSVMLEAMAMGKPVVAATPVSRKEHTIIRHGETGLVYEPDDLEGVDLPPENRTNLI